MLHAGLRAPAPYLPIERHGVIGDRRTAALVAADGTLDSLCLPDFGGDFLFGALLDVEKGGFWRLGPATLCLGSQSYVDNTCSLVTRWSLDEAELELTDVMAWPQRHRPQERRDLRVILRRLRCTRGQMLCGFLCLPRPKFSAVSPPVRLADGAFFQAGEHRLRLWTSRPVEVDHGGARDAFELRGGDEVWAVLCCGNSEESWSVSRARAVVEETERYWRQWAESIDYHGPRRPQIQRSALTVHLLSHAEEGSVAAAVTTSLPERIGGQWNADYRLSWVRDGSLSLSMLARLGQMEDARHYLEWLHGLESCTEAPFQIAYGIMGQNRMDEHENHDLYGYRGSQPVRFGNHAYTQHQHDTCGYLLNCVHTYLEHDGAWEPEFWDLVRRAADWLVECWDRPGASIWELSASEHYVSDRVMTWVGLDRAVAIAEKLGRSAEVDSWRAARQKLYDQVMTRGWSERLKSFKQSYEREELDSALLLIPLLGFLPAEHSRARATVERIAEGLTIDGLAYRFNPLTTAGLPFSVKALGEFEGAFLPCTFWLAGAYARLGQVKNAEAILERAERVAGLLGVFAEAIDPRQNSFLGNYPLLFSQVTYIRAILELGKRHGA